ncbi:hypothetical protein LZ32DRAFT_112024 [Colletotrichum eremochloae]|nr:hypothetical protein LZ32DRAFT_112024 [Colletotrichum eremochloae]
MAQVEKLVYKAHPPIKQIEFAKPRRIRQREMRVTKSPPRATRRQPLSGSRDCPCSHYGTVPGGTFKEASLTSHGRESLTTTPRDRRPTFCFISTPLESGLAAVPPDSLQGYRDEISTHCRASNPEMR